MDWTLDSYYTLLSIVGLVATWLYLGFCALLGLPNFCHRELFPNRRVWNIVVANQSFVGGASNCTAKATFVKLHGNARTRMVTDMPLLWLETEDYVTTINHGDSDTLDVVTLFDEKREFRMRRKSESGQVLFNPTPLPYGLYDVVIRITSKERNKTIVQRAVRIPDDLQALPEA